MIINTPIEYIEQQHASQHKVGGVDEIKPEDIGAGRVNPNLLDNWYFGNPVDQRGGYVTCPGVHYCSEPRDGTEVDILPDGAYYTAKKHDKWWHSFVMNGVTYYQATAYILRGYAVGQYAYSIDRWRFNDGSENVLTVKDNDCVTFSDKKNILTQYKEWSQLIEKPTDLIGKTVTLSALVKNTSGGGNRLIVVFKSGDKSAIAIPAATGTTLVSQTFVVKDTATAGQFRFGFQILHDCSGSMDIIAVKLELGSSQTLAHQDENGNWVLNEIPNYNEQLLRCCMSTADSSDTYANNTILHTGNRDKIFAYGTDDLVSGSSYLAPGTIYFVHE